VTGSDSSKSFTVSSVVNEQDAINHYIDSNNFKTTDSTGNTPVTNLEHERNLNEDKFTIRYIEHQYLETIINEFKSLMRD